MSYIFMRSGKDSAISLPFLVFVTIGSIWVIIANTFFIEMPWEVWFAAKIPRELAILNTFIIGISLALLPLSYEPKLRRTAIYLLCVILIIFGSFWKLSHEKAPFINGMIMLCSVIAFVINRQLLKRKRKGKE